MERQCGECTLCCKLVPVKELNKPANTKCEHQRTLKGCAIYSKRPQSCYWWNCRWLVNNDTQDLRRPDRSHYVIDLVPDFILAVDKDQTYQIQTVQIWIDPKYPDAWKDPSLREYLIRRGEEHIVAQIRFGNEKCIILIPPNMSETKDWIIKDGILNEPGNVAQIANDLEAQGIEVRKV
jgi:hypothetical protein